MKNIAVFGSTGSIGRQTLSVCAAHTDTMYISAIVFGSDIDTGVTQIRQFMPSVVGVFDKAAAMQISNLFPKLTVLSGADVWNIAADDNTDIVVNGVSGFSGVYPLIAALYSGKTVALANKESVVCGGSLVKDALQSGGGAIIPVDSEQSAIFQCLAKGDKRDVSSITLTASGGAFRGFSYEQLAAVTPEMAMRHPTWSMGRKITIDSATLFNKGLEIMEAAFLFDLGGESIRVLVHPQSIVHSMVEYIDGSIIAQLGVPDMRIAIQYALTYPHRLECPAHKLNLSAIGKLEFFDPDTEKFPAIPLAYEALQKGGAAPTAYNSANEIAVERFIHGEIGFMQIAECVEYCLAHMPRLTVYDMDSLLAADLEARRLALEYDPRANTLRSMRLIGG